MCLWLNVGLDFFSWGLHFTVPSVHLVSCGLWSGSRSWNRLDCQNLLLNSVQLDQDFAWVFPIFSWAPRISAGASCWIVVGGRDCNVCPVVPLVSAPWHRCKLKHSDAGSAPLAFHSPTTAAKKGRPDFSQSLGRKKLHTRLAHCTTWVMGVYISTCLQVLGLWSAL